ALPFRSTPVESPNVKSDLANPAPYRDLTEVIKVEMVINWPHPRHFVTYSTSWVLLTSTTVLLGCLLLRPILSPTTKLENTKLEWSSAAERASEVLKRAFTTAPLLQHPNPSSRFIVEVDASNMGMGAVLSQRQGNNPKLKHFFLKKLSPVERNYSTGGW
ncbi:hypothetical protein P4O66_005250, partial [Electrophorus voltai]